MLRAGTPLYLYELFCIFYLLTSGCGSYWNQGKDSDDDNTSIASPKPSRKASGTLYPGVGRVTKNGSHLCSGTIIKHGVFAMAKHCFRGGVPTVATAGTMGLYFPLDGVVGSETIVVTGSSIKEVILDGDGNDIAYIIYDASQTSGRVSIDAPVTSDSPPTSGMNVNLVGFPSPTDRIYRKLISGNCKATGKTGTIPPMKNDEGYDGLLYETNCIAWFGNSGGP
ncbi:MAG: hypothetical protein HQK54_13430, partial [Oligoflexales bacterium]|nr:hypothetical protein [Oligoflexales bacterium]